MKKVVEETALVYYAIIAIITLYFIALLIVRPPPVRHNVCTIAEISPDVTPEERKRCQQMRGHKL